MRSQLLSAASAYFRDSAALIHEIAQLDDVLFRALASDDPQNEITNAGDQMKPVILAFSATQSVLVLLVDEAIRDRLFRFEAVYLMYLGGFVEGRVRSNDADADEQFRTLAVLSGELTNLCAQALGRTDLPDIGSEPAPSSDSPRGS